MSSDNAVIITTMVSILTILLTAYQYLDTKKRDQNVKEFENYHNLIKQLVQPGENNSMYVNSQTAIIFELRHFKRYYSFSLRTLIGLKEKWNAVPNQFPRLIDEIERTIAFLTSTNGAMRKPS